jgi:very-short-patch-repair endonuclease
MDRVSTKPRRPSALTKYRQPVRASDAIAAGMITRSALRGSAWRRLFRDVYVDVRAPDDHKVRVLGAALIMPDGAAISGRSAAVLWGTAEIGQVERVEIVSSRTFGPVNGLSIRTVVLAPEELTTFRGVRITTAVHTAWEIARSRPVLEAVPWIDSLSHARRIAKTDLVGHARHHGGAPGCRRADATLRWCDPRAESPPESELRVHLHIAGILVTPQFWVVIDGECVARVDLALPEIKLAIEYDGQWHGDHHQLGRDRARVRLLNSAGWHVFQVTKEDMRDIPRLIQTIREVIERLK